MPIIAYQAPLRPALPCVYGPIEYRDQRALFEHLDRILTVSGLEEEFLALAVVARRVEPGALSAKRLERFTRFSILALRSNIARHYMGLDHRDFCARLADSPLLQWFLHVGEVDGVKVFSKSTSDRFARWVDQESLATINAKFVALLSASHEDAPCDRIGLGSAISCEDVFFDSTCVKADIHFPIDWVLLRDVTRTLMKATVLIRRGGLRHRMPQEPLEFLSEMNTLCMKMSAKRRAADGRKQRKKVLREMKSLVKRVAKHARNHLKILQTRGAQSDLSAGQMRLIEQRIEGVLAQLPAAIAQAHERIIGERQVPNDQKILSLYDDAIRVIVRGKSGAEVEFGNKLWLGETREGIIADYRFYRDNPGDTTLVAPALRRLVDEQGLAVKNAWGDRGLFSKANEKFLESRGIRSGLCPRDPADLTDRLRNEAGMREGLKRRAGTEARISIITHVFMGSPSRAKGFAHRELMVGWAVLSHNLWVVARLVETERQRRAKDEVAGGQQRVGPRARAA